MGQKAVAAGKVQDPPSPEAPPDPPGRFPGLVQLFSGEDSGPADGPGNGVKQAWAWEKNLLLRRQPVF